MLNLGLKSLLYRKFTVGLTVLAIALSVALLLGVERLREATRTSFSNTVSGIDLIVAARGDDLQILLATVFGVGSTANTVDWDTYQDIASRPEVAWAIPIALGDTHAGFAVMGTTPDYFRYFRFGRDRALSLSEGQGFAHGSDAVIGAEVAERLGYTLGTTFVNAHGSGEIEGHLHDEAPFEITGILDWTGTPVDRMVFISLESFTALHADEEEISSDPLAMSDDHLIGSGSSDGTENVPASAAAEAVTHETEHIDAHHDEEHGHEDHDGSEPGDHHHEEHGELHHDDEHHDGEHHGEAHAEDHPHDADGGKGGDLNAIFVGLSAPEAVLGIQRAIANYEAEPLTGVMPAATLLRLWSITSVAETALRAVAVAVVVAGLIGMIVMLSATLDARRREFAILRSVGATPIHVAALVLLEAALVAASGIVTGLVILGCALAVAGSYVLPDLGLTVAYASLSVREILILLAVALAALLASLVPAWRVFRHTLADGLSIRL